MGESKDQFSLAATQLEQHLEEYKPLRPGFDPEEVEVCRRSMATRLKAACARLPVDKDEADEVKELK